MNLLQEESSENLTGTQIHIVLAGTVPDFSGNVFSISCHACVNCSGSLLADLLMFVNS